MDRLTLNEAIRTGRMADFVQQEEARGIGGADRATLDNALERLIRQPRSEDRTSRSPSDDGSTGT